MKKLLPIAALSFFLFGIAGCSHPVPPPYYAPPPPNAVAHEGFDAGVHAARTDISRGLRPHVDRHARFRNPPVPPGEPVAIYRSNFRRGYDLTYRGGT